MAEKTKTSKKPRRIKEPTLTKKIQDSIKRQQAKFRKKFPDTPEAKKRREQSGKLRPGKFAKVAKKK